ncbi:MAG TPA: SDR family NAD(P)-dependent oxidoreductase [Terriglobales bacterium]|nr:SDR family NAD(P)-dependent oxidoreductase [Terriglobales bacterium]
MRGMMDLRGKSVLITGAARRIGRSIALGFAAAGANVSITYLNSEKDASRTVADLTSLGVQANAIRADVREEQSIAAAITHTVQKFGGLDVLVNNAAVYETVRFEQITLEQWDRMFETNTRGPFLSSKAAIEALRRSNGRIINIGSLGGIRPWATHAHYCSSKAALIMLTQAMAKALAPLISVNCVAPGMISTGENRDEALIQKIAAKTPMKRAGTPEDVAEAVLFFAQATHFITGQVITVDGGLGLE